MEKINLLKIGLNEKPTYIAHELNDKQTFFKQLKFKHMTNLLSIESAFLSNANVKTALNLTEVKSLQRTLLNGQKKKFEQTLQLSTYVAGALNWFKSEAGKLACNEAGITWSTEEFSLKVYGWQKSYFYKVVKAGNLAPEVIDTFKAKCDTLESEGKDSNRTLEGLLKYAKTGATGNDGEEGEEASVERVETVFTMAYKRENGNVSVRVDANGVFKTSNSVNEILEAIEYLKALLPA